SGAGVVSRRDYMPFGEELGAGIGGRTTGMGFSAADGLRQKFTSKEQDIETGLDYFEARYYASSQGRFTSPDDFFKDSQPEDPQSWNKYAYVRNNPLQLIDPSGEKARVTVQIDKKNKTGTVTIEANFAVYAAPNQGVIEEQLQDQADRIKEDIESTYSGTFTKNGITYTVSAQVNAQVVSSEKDAVEGGKKGTFDNIVEIGTKTLVDRASGTADAASYHLAGEKFDRVKARSSVDPTSNLFGHESSHLLGSRSHNTRLIGPGDVSSADNPTAPNITNRDFSHLFGAQIRTAARSAKPNVGTRQAPTVSRRRVYWR
ncbi:MAG: RHS repeat-associated core domain-containing protein, partial [Pyrinomonadaceae bacterium]